MARKTKGKKVKALDKDLDDPEFVEREEDIEEEEADPSAPKHINPYTVLNIETSATQDEVKSAYRKSALIHHPDKAKEEDKATANSKFQELAFAYAILSDPARRKRYDITGRTDEAIDGDEDFDWLSFYRAQFEDVITQEHIDAFAKEYKGSEEEKEHLREAYTRYEGRLGKIYEAIMCSEVMEDDDRFRAFFDQEIAEGRLEAFEAYTRETDASRQVVKDAEVARKKSWDAKQAKKTEKQKKEGAKKGKGKEDVDSMADLAAMIQQRQKQRQGGGSGGGADFFARLEEKYAPKGRKRASPMDEPSEEMFAKNAKRGKKSKGA